MAHAGFLADLATQSGVLGRDLFVVLRDPVPPPGRQLGLLRRAEETAALLAVAGVHLAPLTHAEVIAGLAPSRSAAVLEAACEHDGGCDAWIL